MIRILIPGAFAVVGMCVACSSEDGVARPPGHGLGGSSGKGGLDAGSSLAAPKVSVLDAHPVLNEKHAQVYVVLSHPASKSVNVKLATADGSAKSASGDYVPVSQTLTIPAGSQQVAVNIDVETPYKLLTLETSLSREFKTKLSQPTNATIDDGDGVVTLAQAGMVIETPLATRLQDGDIVPDFNGDKQADLVLTGQAGKGTLLLTPAARFEEAAHVVVNETYLDAKQAFAWEVNAGKLGLVAGVVAGDASMAWDQNGDGRSDILILGESKAHLLYGHTGPFFDFASGDPRLEDGQFGTHLADLKLSDGYFTLQTADFDGDGVTDFGQAGRYSSAAGGDERFHAYYGSKGQYPGSYSATETFSFQSGTTAVGQASLSHGSYPGLGADLNGDKRDDLIFVGLAANDGQFGGNYLYVRFGTNQKLVDQNMSMNGTLDGANGFQISHANYLSTISSYVPQDAGDVNGDGIDDLVMLGGGVPLSVVFGKQAAYTSGNYSQLEDLGPEAAFFDTDKPASARVGDLNRDGIDDVVFITENKLRVVWGQKNLVGKPIFGTQYPEVGEIEIDPASGLDSVGVVGDIDGDQTADVIVFSQTWAQNTGAALILFGKTLTRIFGGPDLELPEIK